MKALVSALREKKKVVFLDFEGTQIEAEMIALGAMKCRLIEGGIPAKPDRGLNILVKPINKVGHIVKELTGLSDAMLSKKGIPFKDALSEFKKYVGVHADDFIYVAYGNNDIRILEQSASFHRDSDIPFIRTIKRNFLDFSMLLGKYLRDEHGNLYSLTNAMKKLGVAPEGHPHDAYYDAYNLYLLFRTFAKNPPILRQEYEKTIMNNQKLPAPVGKLLRKLVQEGTVTKEDFDNLVGEALK